MSIQGGGDRTGTYTWQGGVELAETILHPKSSTPISSVSYGKSLGDSEAVSVLNKRVIDLGTGTGTTINVITALYIAMNNNRNFFFKKK